MAKKSKEKIEEKKEEIIEEVPKKEEILVTQPALGEVPMKAIPIKGSGIKIPKFKSWAEKEKFYMKHPNLSSKE